MKLGETIRLFRIANDNTSTKQFAKACQVSSTYISEVEHDNKKPSLVFLKNIAFNLNVPLSKILEIQELSEEGNWNFQKTLLEILKIYVGE